VRTEEENMDRTITQPVVLVGFGGSEASCSALIWAAHEARRRAAVLKAIQVWQPHPARAPYAGTGHGTSGLRPRPASADHLAADVHAVLSGALGADAGHLVVVAELAEGIAERVLADASADADLLVLGSGGQSPVAHSDPLITDRPVGPVVRACLSHCRCPVVIIGPAMTADRAAARCPLPGLVAW
jgi:nucleotide-binding universal stress UspA family protein